MCCHGGSLRKTHTRLLSFPYVCPGPGLAKTIVFHKEMSHTQDHAVSAPIASLCLMANAVREIGRGAVS